MEELMQLEKAIKEAELDLEFARGEMKLCVERATEKDKEALDESLTKTVRDTLRREARYQRNIAKDWRENAQEVAKSLQGLQTRYMALRYEQQMAQAMALPAEIVAPPPDVHQAPEPTQKRKRGPRKRATVPCDVREAVTAARRVARLIKPEKTT